MTTNRILELLRAIRVIQGGMGVNISTPFLARIVAMLGGLGIISGVALERVFAYILMNGDPDGHLHRALAHFPLPGVAKRICDRYYEEGGSLKCTPYKGIPMYTINPSRALIELNICANFSFAWLAQEGHDGLVGVNYLTKIEMSQIHALYGAILGGIKVVVMGAGIPRNIPGVLDAFMEKRQAEYPISITGRKDKFPMTFDPAEFFKDEEGVLPELTRPAFIPIVSSDLLASILVKKGKGKIDGLIIEGSTAGGHNAPPRDPCFNDRGEPIYGPRDVVDIQKIKDLNVPFWLAGGCNSPNKLLEALAQGATGIQAGTIFALADESGMNSRLKTACRKAGYNGNYDVFTSIFASPTHFPFKVFGMEGTLSEKSVRDSWNKKCDQGALVTPYTKDPNNLDFLNNTGYRCPAEPLDDFLRKGGDIDLTTDVTCLCNGLLNTAGLVNANKLPHGQHTAPTITTGDDLAFLPDVMPNENSSYGAADAMDHLLSKCPKSLPDV